MSSIAVLIPLHPGKFYRASGVGHFTDVASGLVFNGCKVEVETLTRRILRVSEVGTPIQMPTHRTVSSMEKVAGHREPQRVETLIPFQTHDELDIIGGIFAAVQTGVIEVLEDSYVERLFPEVFAARQAELVWRRDVTPVPAMSELIALHDKWLDAQAKHRADNGTIAVPPPAS